MYLNMVQIQEFSHIWITYELKNFKIGIETVKLKTFFTLTSEEFLEIF